MSSSSPINVTILDKEYLIACEEHEKEQLHSAVDYLNEKLLEMKNNGGVIGSERIAVMTALNIASEMLAYKNAKEDYTSEIGKTVQRLQGKINEALTRCTQLEIT